VSFGPLSRATAAATDPVSFSWASWRPATCMPEACFCEAIRAGWVAQPANTWSNLAFVLVGLLVIARGRADTAQGLRRSPITERATYSAVYGGTCILVGMGSTFYHASLTFAGQFFDVMGMYLFAVFILLYALTRLSPLRQGTFLAAYVGLNAILGYLLLTVPSMRRWLFGLVLIAVLALESRAARSAAAIDRYYLRAAVITLSIAFAIWILDMTKVLCAPESWLQGHAVWHLLCATSAGLAYFYYRSERPAVAREG
jgi:hypothetical protein